MSDGAPRNNRAWLETHYQSSRLFAAVDRVSTDVSVNKHMLLRELANGTRKEVTSHPLLDFLGNPWKSWGGGSLQSLLYLTQAWLEHNGEAFWLLIPGMPGSLVPYEVWPCPPHWVSATPLPKQPWFQIAPLGVEVPELLPCGAVVWFRMPNLVNPFGRGRGRSGSVDDEVSQDIWAAKFNSAWFRNGSRPDMLISVPGLKDAQQERLREQWEARHRGFLNAFRTAFVAAEVKATLLTPSHKDMEFTELRKANRDNIYQAFCLPPEIMGVVENSNRATAEAADFLYAKNGKLPRLQFLYGELNRLFVPMFRRPNEQGKLVLAFENPVKETEEFRLRKALDSFKAGLIHRDRALKELGWDPVGGERGAEYLVPVNTTAQGPTGPPAAPIEAPPAEGRLLEFALEAAREVLGELPPGALRALPAPRQNGRSACRN